MAKTDRAIPPSVVRRLTRYLTHVQTLRGEGVEWVSSQELASTLGLTSSTVRQDLSYVDFSGISKRGYETAGLEEVLTAILGADQEWNLIVVGAGNLGRALALHEEFTRRGFHIRGIFDNDPKKIGRKVGNLTIRGMEDVPSAVAEEKIDIGVIAVPAGAAQAVSDALAAAGIKGLLNLALPHIVAPPHVAIIDARVVASLLELTHAITSGG